MGMLIAEFFFFLVYFLAVITAAHHDQLWSSCGPLDPAQ